MENLQSRLSRARLLRPRLLPATIAAMTALLAVKSAILVQAAAEETGGSSQIAQADSAQPDNAPTPAKSVPSAGDQTQRSEMRSSGKTPPALAEQPVSKAERFLLLDLRHRRETLDERSHDLDQREAELGAADRRLADRVAQLTALQTKLESLEASRQHHAAENWTGLVKVYEAMKPRDAAAIFDALDMQVLLQVLDRMQDRRAAPVLAAMLPDRARLATQMLAEMRTRAITTPTQATTSINPKS